MRFLYKLLWNSTTELDFEKITINKKEQIKGNTMTITFEDKSQVLDEDGLIFDQDQSIQLFCKYDYTGSSLDTSVTSPDLLFNGRIKTIKLKTSSKWQCTIECVDKSYDTLNRIWGQNFSNKTAPEIVKELIRWASRNSDGTYDIDTTIDTSFPFTGGIQGKRSATEDFPTLNNFGLSHKPVFEWLETIADTNYTNTEDEINNNEKLVQRPMVYYIDSENKFQWFIPTDTPNHYLKYGDNSIQGSDTRQHRIISDSLTFGTFDEVNFIIYKAGEDMDNVQILDYEIDSTASTLQPADSFRNWEDIAREMKKVDLAAGNITFVKSDEYDYPDSGDYPLHPAWMPGSATVASDSEYNSKFREVAIQKADARAWTNFNATGSSRWSGTLSLYGEQFNPTDLIDYTREEYGLNNLKLRITDISYNIDKNSFITNLTVKEDEANLL